MVRFRFLEVESFRGAVPLLGREASSPVVTNLSTGTPVAQAVTR